MFVYVEGNSLESRETDRRKSAVGGEHDEVWLAPKVD